MSQEIIMPKLGLTMTHGIITRWLKQEGEPVKAGEIVVEIETDKINSEVESPIDGYILKILANEGDEKEITSPLCLIGTIEEINSGTGSGNTGMAENTAGRIFITPVARKLAKENNIAVSTLKGTGPVGRIVKKDILKVIEERAVSRRREDNTVLDGRMKITPVARKIAEEHGLDLAGIAGTGPDGRIVKEDVLSVVQGIGRKEDISTQDRPAVHISTIATVSQISPEIGNEARKTPMSSIRRITSRRLSQSKHDIPHAYFKTAVIADGIAELKNRLAEAVVSKTGRKLTLNDIVIKAVGETLRHFPDINVSLSGDEIIYHRDINIGIAVNTDKGLVVPVVKNAAGKSISEICTVAGGLVDKARNGKLAADDINGGTFTVTNLGPYGIDEFTAIINPPESAILAVGTARQMPWTDDGNIVVRTIMNLTLSVDHRVIDGALAAQFMKKLVELLENPYSMLI